MPSGSIYDNAVLNGIASGIITRTNLSTNLNINYYTITKIVNRLIKKNLIIENTKEKTSLFLLSKKEKHRLFNFQHTLFVIDNNKIPLFNIDAMDAIYKFKDLDIFLIYNEYLDSNIAYAHTYLKTEDILNKIDVEYELSTFLPSLYITHKTLLEKNIIENIILYSNYKFPIFYIDIDKNINTLNIPDIQDLQTFENTTADKIFTYFQKGKEYTIQNISTNLKYHKETVRKTLNMLVKQKKIQKKINMKFADSLFYLPIE